MVQHRFNSCLFLIVLVFASGCDVTPMGRQQLTLMPPEYLDDMGRQAFAAMKSSEPIAQNSRSEQQVSCIARHVIDAANRLYPGYTNNREWEVVVFDNPAANAFAMPGNKIGVFTGLIELAEDDDQLAAVIGHEVGHVLARHGNERVSQELGISAILLLIGLFTEIDSQLALQALGLGAHYGVTLPFSRAHETEADIIGLNLMSAAGFDPNASVGLWQNMSSASAGGPPEFLSTHPGHDTRIENLQENIPPATQRMSSAVDC